jgi:hypothetical protein
VTGLSGVEGLALGEIRVRTSSRAYLVEDPERERESVRTLVALPFIGEKLFLPLGLNPYFSWFILFAKKDRLLPHAKGDIDILAGPLEWNNPEEFASRLEEERKMKIGWHPSWPPLFTAMHLARTGGIKWPPATSYMVAVEAKCSYLSPNAKRVSLESIKSTKASLQKLRRMRAQVAGLVQMGFDRVALLDVIANPPATGLDGQAWLVAADIAGRSRRCMQPILNDRLPRASPAGHFVWSVGAVVAGDESSRGAGCPLELRRATENLFLHRTEQTKASRQEVENNLRREFERIRAPCELIILLRDCDRCGQIHPENSSCPTRE